MKHLLDYVLFVKDKLEQNITTNEDILKNIDSNLESSVTLSNASKASLLKKDIQERGKVVKMDVDSIALNSLKCEGANLEFKLIPKRC